MTHSKFHESVIALILFTTACLSPIRVHAADATITLKPDTASTHLGGEFTLSVMVDTAGYASGGVGTVIKYDPDMVAATHINPGSIFADYPLTTIDQTNGKITISGIAASADHLYTGAGEFATVTFLARNVGTGTISFDFTPGSTRDSNIAVMFGNGDVLARVGQAKITILQTDVGAMGVASPPPVAERPGIRDRVALFLGSLNLPFLRDRYASVRSGRSITQNVDPLGPITRQPPITDPLSVQPAATVYNIGVATAQIMKLGVIAIILLTILAILLIFYRRSTYTYY